MKRSLLTVLTLVTFLPAAALAARPIRVTLPNKTKNACLRKVARLTSALKNEDALAELSTPGCTENLETEEQLWVDLMQGVLYQGLEQTTQAEDAFCLALLQEPLASLPLAKPPAALDELFERMRAECPEREKAKAEQLAKAKAEADAAAAAEAAAAAAAKAAKAAPPPVAELPPEPVVNEFVSVSSLRDSFELYAGVHGEADMQRVTTPLPLWGASVQGSVHLFRGLRAGAGLTALASTRFSSGPIFLVMADARLAYPILPPNERLGLHVYASGGPLLYTTNSPAAGARAGLGLALDLSKVRVSLGGAYEWRSHYRLGYAAPMASLDVSWKLSGAPRASP
ncbi:hypothetical protein [Archangium sp.]|jgi:hypothetical protein|uniref:hypothetical protein n=1 Tax=Archangium sp. TaxID=1872627 RepID=UPI002EDA1F93